MQILTPKKIRARLGMSFAEFDRLYGYPPKTTREAVRRWHRRQDGFPGGRQAEALLMLSRHIGMPVSPVIAAVYAA